MVGEGSPGWSLSLFNLESSRDRRRFFCIVVDQQLVAVGHCSCSAVGDYGGCVGVGDSRGLK